MQLKPVVAILMMLFSLSLFGQSNPFDLKYRPAGKPTTTPVTPKLPDTIAKPPALGQSNPLNTSSLNVEKDTSILQLGTPQTDSQATQSATDNPFEKRVETATTSTPPTTNTEVSPAPVTKPPIQGPAFRINKDKGFQIFFILLSLLFMIFIVNIERSYVRDLWRVIANENYSSLHHRNQRNAMRQILMLMGYAVFIMQAGIFIFHVVRVLGKDYSGVWRIWIPLLGILGIYLVRHIIIRYLRWLFNNQKEMTLFGFDISIFNTMVGLVLLPINIFILFGPENIIKPLIIIGLIVIGAAYLMRQLRWLLTARQLIANSLFLFFVYLCAIEILPLWALSKFFW